MFQEVTGFKFLLFSIFVIALFSLNFYLFFLLLIFVLKILHVVSIGSFFSSILFVLGFFASIMVTIFMVGFISFYFGLRFKPHSEWDNYTPVPSDTYHSSHCDTDNNGDCSH